MDLRRYELVTIATAARNFYSKALDALGVEPDTEYAALADGQPERHAVWRLAGRVVIRASLSRKRESNIVEITQR